MSRSSHLDSDLAGIACYDARRGEKGSLPDRARDTDPFSAWPPSQSADGKTPTPGGLEMITHAIGSAQEHLPARLESLEAEQDLTRVGDIAAD